jgi:hypothetical protein
MLEKRPAKVKCCGLFGFKEDFRNKIPDFRPQTIGCDGVVVWRLTSYFSRFPKTVSQRLVVKKSKRCFACGHLSATFRGLIAAKTSNEIFPFAYCRSLHSAVVLFNISKTLCLGTASNSGQAGILSVLNLLPKYPRNASGSANSQVSITCTMRKACWWSAFSGLFQLSYEARCCQTV